MAVELRVEESVWDEASELRRAEWRTLIADLLDEAVLFPRHTAAMLLTINADGLLNTTTAERHALWSAALTAHADEYLRTITLLLDETLHAARLEALDMAKKVVHDQAARALAALAPQVADSHESYRRLFSLVISLRVDTTKLPTAHGHRRSFRGG